MKSPKKLLALLLALVFSLALISGCGEKPADTETPDPAPTEDTSEPEKTPEPEEVPEEPASPHAGEWEFTDSLGRTVTFNGPLTKVAPSGKMAQQCIYAVAPQVIIGLSSDLSESEASYFPAEFADLPIFGTFYGKKANFNRESVLAAGPQVIIDVGEVKKNMEEDLNALQEQLGIPVIFIEAELTDMAPTFSTLGDILDAPEQGSALSDYCAATIADAQEKAASIPENERKTLYYGVMDSGLTTCGKGSFHTGVIDLVAAENVAPADLGHSFADIDMERLLTWDPDVIIFAPFTVYDKVADDPVWADVRAIKEGNYYEIPFGPYNWIDQPPAANRVLGVKWLGNLLYPEVFDYDMIAETIQFYDLFYHVSLTEDDAHAMMANSTYREQK